MERSIRQEGAHQRVEATTSFIRVRVDLDDLAVGLQRPQEITLAPDRPYLDGKVYTGDFVVPCRCVARNPGAIADLLRLD